MWRPGLLILSIAALAAWIDLGRPFHQLHDGGSIVPVLVSLVRWTPFYWQQDRFGMLVPLLATPFRDPFANLLVQNGLTIFLALLSFFALARCALGRDGWIPVGACCALVWLLLVPTKGCFELLSTAQPYGTSMALGAGGLVALEPGSGRARWLARLLGAACIMAASWVNVTIALALGPVVFARAILSKRVRDSAISLGILAAGLLASLAASAMEPYHRNMGGVLAPRDWPASWAGLAGHAWTESGGVVAWTPLCALAVLGCGIMVLGRRRAPAAPASAGRAALSLLAGSLASFAVVGSLAWTKENLLLWRYAIPSVLLAQTALATLGLRPLLALAPERARRAIGPASLAALAAAVLVSHGPPSLADVRDDLDRRLGERTADVLEAGCTHIVGDYWAVWPTVYHASLVLHERGSDRRVWGISARSLPTLDLWAAVPVDEMRIAAPLGDEWAADYLNGYRFPEMFTERRMRTISVLRPVGARPDGR